MIPYARQKTWVDNTGQQVDSAWLNNVEDSLVSALGVAPATNGALVWDGAKFTAAALLKDAQIDPAAAIARSKLNFGSGLVNADIAAAAAIAPSKIGGGYAPNKITVSTLAGGPPGAPSDGDIWIATSVASPKVRWSFQYDSSETTYKWVFIGGGPMAFTTSGAYSNTVAGTWQVPGTFGTAISRSGIYHAVFTSLADNEVGGTAGGAIAPSINGANDVHIAYNNAIPNGGVTPLSGSSVITFTAGQTVDLAFFASSISGGKVTFSVYSLSLTPLKVI